MKIGVVADTHSKDLPSDMLQAFRGVDLIIHAGDFCTMDDVKAVGKGKEIEGVYGNMDDHQVTKAFPASKILTVEGRRIGIIHGEGPPPRVLDGVKKAFSGKKVDAVIYGHSHVAFNETLDGVLYFNPGSPTDTIFAPFRSFGILDVTSERIQGHIVRVKD